MLNAVLSLLVLLIFALLGGAFVLWRKGGSGKQIMLMIILALVIAVNIGIWTLPDAAGQAPAEKLPQ